LKAVVLELCEFFLNRQLTSSQYQQQSWWRQIWIYRRICRQCSTNLPISKLLQISREKV